MKRASPRRARTFFLVLAAYFCAVQFHYGSAQVSSDLPKLGGGELAIFALLGHALGLALTVCCVGLAFTRRAGLLVRLADLPGALALLAVGALLPLYFELVAFVTTLEVEW